ncbi:MAG: phosphate/phosphite/phosphonate ABC transporter substrate-binding protein, partial [Pseudomonadota bacterium]
MRRYLYILLFIIQITLSIAVTYASELKIKTLTLGVFAYRPKAIIEERYQPLVDYLNTHLHQCRIELRVLELDELETALTDKQLDFVFTNPRHYIVLRHNYQFNGAIATLIKRSASGEETQQLGGVIFTRSSEYSINRLADIKGHRIAIPGTKYMGGYQTQAYELLQAGIKLPDDARLIEVGRHDKVINSVLSKEADIGFVRTEILENLSQEGKLDLSRIKVLNRQKITNFPFISSTRLYPEWPFIALPHVEVRVTSRIASALLAINGQQIFIHNAGIAGFAPPADYFPVEEIARALRLPPFDNIPDFTLHDIWKKHNKGILILSFFLFTTLFLIIVLLRRNNTVLEQQTIIQQHA